MNDNQKGLKIVEKYFQKAKKEAQTKGFRENLGYDLQGNVQQGLEALDLPYYVETELVCLFIRKINNLSLETI